MITGFPGIIQSLAQCQQQSSPGFLVKKNSIYLAIISHLLC